MLVHVAMQLFVTLCTNLRSPVFYLSIFVCIIYFVYKLPMLCQKATSQLLAVCCIFMWCEIQITPAHPNYRKEKVVWGKSCFLSL